MPIKSLGSESPFGRIDLNSLFLLLLLAYADLPFPFFFFFLVVVLVCVAGHVFSLVAVSRLFTVVTSLVVELNIQGLWASVVTVHNSCSAWA